MLTNYQPINGGVGVPPKRLNRKRLFALGAGVVALAVCFLSYMPSKYVSRVSQNIPSFTSKQASPRSAMPFMEMNDARPAGMVIHLPDPVVNAAPVSAMNLPSTFSNTGNSLMRSLSSSQYHPSFSTGSVRSNYSPYNALSRSFNRQVGSPSISGFQPVQPNSQASSPFSVHTSINQDRSRIAPAFPNIVPPREYGRSSVAQTNEQPIIPSLNLQGSSRISDMNTQNVNGLQSGSYQNSPSSMTDSFGRLDRVLAGRAI